MIKGKVLVLGIVAALAVGANAQQWSSFNLANFSGVHIANQGGNTFKLTIDSGAKFTYNSVVYNVAGIFGFYALHKDHNGYLGGSTAGIATPANWTYSYINNDGGEVAGWDTNPAHHSVLPGQSLTFTFPTVINTANIQDFGLHASADKTIVGTSGQTAFFKYAEAVPEPFTMLLGVAGLGVAVAKRRSRKA
jgi:hypothetical protein